MMKKALFLLGLFVLSACAPRDMRLVDAVDAPQFVAMSKAMRPVMLHKHLVDHRGSWYSAPLALRPADAGAALAERLSPAFLKSDEFTGSTFRASLKRDAVVKQERFAASIRQNGKIVTLELTAVTDWDGNGKDDWLVSARIGEADEPRVCREYFLVITDVKAPVLQPRVLLVQEIFGGRKTVTAEPFHSELAGSEAEEFLQGQTNVTEAPAEHIEKKLDSSRVTSSALSR